MSKIITKVRIDFLVALSMTKIVDDTRPYYNRIYMEYHMNCVKYIVSNGHYLIVLQHNQDNSSFVQGTDKLCFNITSSLLKSIKIYKHSKLVDLIVDGSSIKIHDVIKDDMYMDIPFDWRMVLPKRKLSGEIAQFNIEYLYTFSKVVDKINSFEKRPGAILDIHHNGSGPALVRLFNESDTDDKGFAVIMPYRGDTNPPDISWV